MDDLINAQYEEIDKELEAPLPVEVVRANVVMPVEKKKSEEEVAIEQAMEMERRKRNLELMVWAEELKFLRKGAPKKEDVEEIYKRILEGKTLSQALEGICSYSTWRKWREEYPILMDMEEEARQRRIASLQEMQRRIADGEDIDGKQIAADKDSIKKITRAKLRIDTMQSEIDRYDRLTASRNGKMAKSQTLVPIQINVGYGRKS